MGTWSRFFAVAVLMPASIGISARGDIPTDWTDPNTGHRVVRLSREDGSQSSYFHQNEFTPDGEWIIFRSNMLGPTHVFKVEVAKAGQ